MVDDNQNNDEYKFEGLGSLENDPLNNIDEPHAGVSSYEVPSTQSPNNVKRNALITIGIIILLVLIYRLFSPSPIPKNTMVPVTTTTQPVATTTTTVQQQPQEMLQPIVVKPQPLVSENTQNLNNKVNSIERSQQNVRDEVNAVSQQVSTVNTNVNNLNNQITNLNQTINNLTSQLAKQSEQINALTMKAHPKVVRKVVRSFEKPVHYHIQAIIPGRAWLIGTNGSTLTVREGTKVAGYGTVKLIDSMDGRIITSSGHVIRFSQDDS